MISTKPKLTLVLTALCMALTSALRAAPFLWDGGSSGSPNWTDGTNWSPDGAPANNGTADITFGGNVDTAVNVDAAQDVASLFFNSTSGAFVISGNQLTIRAGGVVNGDSQLQSINTNIVMGTSQTWQSAAGPLSFTSTSINNGGFLLGISGSSAVTISSGISGAGGFLQSNTFTVTLSGPVNTYTGTTTVNAGTLILAKATGVDAFAGPLVIGDGSGSDTVQWNASNQTNFAAITVNSLGLLNLNGFTESISTLTMNGGAVAIGAGTLNVGTAITMTGGTISSTGAGKLLLNSPLTTNASAPASIGGNVDLGGAVRTFTIADSPAADDLDVSAAISNGGITKTGTGTLRFSGSGSNTYVNITTVNAGTLALGKTGGATAIAGSLVIGDGTGGTNADVVRYFADNQLNNITFISIAASGLLDLNGFSDVVGNLALVGGNVQTGTGQLSLFSVTTGGSPSMASIAGNLDFGGAARSFDITESGLAVELEVSAALHNGALVKNNIGTLRLSGATANTHGTTTVNAGRLFLAKTISNAAIPGALIIGDGAGTDTVRLELPNQIADTSTINIASSGILDLNGQNDTVGPITIAGNSEIVTGAGTLTVAGDIASITGAPPAAAEGIIIGNLALSGARNINVEDGTASPDFSIPGNISGGPLVMNGPGELYLSGNNSAPVILNAGTLTVQNNNALSANAALFNGGIFRAIGTRTIATPIVFGGPSTIDIDNFDSLTLSGLLSGTSVVAKQGSGTLSVTSPFGNSLRWILNEGTLNSPNLKLEVQGSLTMNSGSFTGALENHGTFTYNGGNFSASLANHGLVIINNSSFTVGGGISNFANMSLNNGLILTTFGLTNNGQLDLQGAIVALNAPGTNNGGINGFGTIGGPGAFVNNGMITQGGGNLTFSSSASQTNNGSIDLAPGRLMIVSGSNLNNKGTINLNGAFISAAQTLTNSPGGTIAGRGTISSFFFNSGLILVTSGTLNLPNGVNSDGVIAVNGLGAALTGDTITNGGTIQGNGSIGNDVNNLGTIEPLGGTLILETVTNSGTIAASTGNKVLVRNALASNSGLINLTGGTFDHSAGNLLNSGQISGYGTFRALGFINDGSMTFSGGTSTINGNVTNNADHQIRVAYNPALFTGTIENFGTFKNTSTTITFAGEYHEHGTFISDPADNFFSNVSIGESGAWVGGYGDRFFLSGDLRSTSKARTSWQTVNAGLHFTGGISHLLSIAGDDLGISFDGYNDNFAWGSLVLEPADRLVLQDANGQPGGALYVDHLDLRGGLPQIFNITGNGMTLYYHLGNPNNAYFEGKTYQLAGGGTISPVPEPGCLCGLFLLLAASGARRRRQREEASCSR